MRIASFCLALWLTASAPAAEPLDGISHRDKLYDIAAAGKIVLVAGYPGLLLRSEDGGASWKLVDPGVRDALFAVKLLADGRGLIVGRAGLVLSTRDGGASWNKENSEVEENLFAVDLLPSGHAWAVGNFGVIIHSPDGGRTWERQSFDATAPQGCVLSDAERENEGASEEARLNAVAFADERRGWAAGEFGLVLHTEDGGASWRRQSSATGMLLFDIHLLDTQRILVTGSEGTLMRSDDGGTSWKLIPTATDQHLFRAAPRGGDVFLPSQNGLIFVLREGGAFDRIDLGIPAWINTLVFLDDETALAAGGRGHLFVTRDGWKSWEKISGR